MKIEPYVNNNYEAKVAIIVYKSKSNYYCESHRILPNGGVGPGQPLQNKTIARIAKSFTEKKIQDAEKDKFQRCFGPIPNNLLYIDQGDFKERFVWFRMGGSMKLYFNIRESKYPKQLSVMIPKLIFLTKGSLHIFAIKDMNPDLNTILYEAPFPNINDNGGVCLGNVQPRITKSSFEDYIRIYENSFFASEFTSEHLNQRRASISILELWKEVSRTQKFNNDYLIKHGEFKTVRDAIRSIYGEETLY